MTDRSRRAANADPAHESEDARDAGGQGQPDDAHGSGDGRGTGEGRDGREDNPFAAPPEGEPEKPWQPRHPKGGHGEGGSRWGSQWSRNQPGRQDGGFGGPRRPEQNGNDNGGGRKTPGLRWDPTDPKQRHARYALHGGIWGVFFAMFGLIEIALLLGALSVYWGISALRGPSSVRSMPTATASAQDVAGTDRKPAAGEAPGDAARGAGGGRSGKSAAGMEVTVTPAQAAKARRTAAIGGLVAGLLTLLAVAGDFTQRMVYDEYFTCRQDALTQAAREQCDELPDEEIPPLTPMTEEPDGQ